MGFVESVSGKLRHQVKNLFDLLGRILPLHRAFNEALALLRHFFRFLLAHGTTEQVGFAEGVAGEPVRDLHHLLLIHDHPQGLFQDFF